MPPKGYPIPDLAHARSAMAFSERYATKAQRKKIARAIYRKFKTARKWPSVRKVLGLKKI